MKLIISIGPDLLAVHYKSKKSCREALKRLAKKRVRRKDSLELLFKGRKYAQCEVKESEVFTLNEFFESCKGLIVKK